LGWMGQLAGLSPQLWRGVIQDTASTSCLVALLVARERATGFSQEADGLAGFGRPVTVYTSEQAHTSVAKAALLAGFGRANLRLVGCDPATFAMRPDVLARSMAADAADGCLPAAVVATIGTTASTAIDPVAEIVEVSRRHNAFVHVDAALAGSAMLLPECAPLFEGLDGADSICWNPHKWMGTALDCSLFYVRNVAELNAVMSTRASYLAEPGAPGAEAPTQYRDWGIPLGRRFRALKLYFQLRLDGVEAIRARLRRDLVNAAWLAREVAATPNWTVLAPVPLQTVCVLHEPRPGLSADELDRHTLYWCEAVNRSGRAHLTPALLGARYMVRCSIGAEATERSDVEEVWRLMREHAEAAP
ncbi:MAG: pyridoxal phosphate-dependent decarboxylase family protein, partial [Acidimicrobiales bacterium]